MSLLTDSELWALVPNADNLDAARAIEAAILAKLAAKELPEPLSAQFQTLDTSDWHNFIDTEHQANTKEDGRWPMRYLFSAAQLHEAHVQGFAAGAAAQLAEKPSGYLSQYNLEMLQQGYPQTIVMLEGAKRDVPLYTRR